MAVELGSVPKASWADEVGEELDQFQPQIFTDENGLKTVIEYRINDDGKKVKITRKIRTKLVQEHVNRAVAERKKWAKFGQEAGKQPGPDLSTTTVGENIALKLSWASSKHAVETEADQDAKVKAALKGKKILCRICKGDHFTTKCPFKDTLAPLDEITASLGASAGAGESGAATAAASGAKEPEPAPSAEQPSSGGKYVAPHLRGDRKGDRTGDSPREKRDDTATLRVTNLSEETTEADLYDLFRRFGQIGRVYLARDRETNICKGFAFVSFVLREDAAKAQQTLDGYGYDNLILHVEWAKSSS
ncbi:uncharacterized protein VTP21DRAFT_5498 [Calcarisporiella thermophila]|uniref:uncharacterized protein n=1 Tax=Calcarisporiella thermophila TaxID=911321 RepID=UPI003743C28F